MKSKREELKEVVEFYQKTKKKRKEVVLEIDTPIFNIKFQKPIVRRELQLKESLFFIEEAQTNKHRVCIIPDIPSEVAVRLKDLGYKLSPRLMDKNEEFYYKVYLV